MAILHSTGTDLVYHDITTVSDPYYDDWLDIYQTSFTLNEQMKVSEINRLLRRKERGEATSDRLTVATTTDNQVAAMAMVDIAAADSVAVLWYIAVQQGMRSGGIGSMLYTDIIRLIFADKSIAAVIFEVEDPYTLSSEDEVKTAERRIAFYHRQGATLFGGINYVQSVGWQPPMPMSLMIHPRPGTKPSGEAAFMLAKRVFAESLQRTGEITLT